MDRSDGQTRQRWSQRDLGFLIGVSRKCSPRKSNPSSAFTNRVFSAFSFMLGSETG